VSPVLQVRDVDKSFGPPEHRVPVLRGVELTIMPGEKASLIGPSGCGKSTLLSLVAGLLAPDTGTIEIEGTPMSSLDDTGRARVRAHRIGIALQSDNLVPFLTASENVEVALAFGRRPRRADARRAARALLERFGVLHRADHLPRHLSGGEAQRVALAVAMANEPVLLLADEVVASLDGATAGEVMDEVLAAEFAVLFVAHHEHLADRAPERYELVDHEVRRR
jgi:predicted ABC-type transport system involved in lysophospholipase L1 biosynthesis ATPase subunit